MGPTLCIAKLGLDRTTNYSIPIITMHVFYLHQYLCLQYINIHVIAHAHYTSNSHDLLGDHVTLFEFGLNKISVTLVYFIHNFGFIIFKFTVLAVTILVFNFFHVCF